MKSNNEETINMQAQASSASRDYEVQIDTSMGTSIDTSIDNYKHCDADSLVENQYRAGAYSMLATLLQQAPQQEFLNSVTGLADVITEKDDFAIAMSMLGLAARDAKPAELDDEYHALFIGLGRGELVPYGSWYLTGFLMEKPLGVLRDDLATMGFERTNDTCEPEDHIAALCEVMVLLINEGRSLDEQMIFFEAHMAPWLSKFFTDLSEAKSAVFYRSVARFGKAFFNFEKQYLAMKV